MEKVLASVTIFASSSLGKDSSLLAEFDTKNFIANIIINLFTTSCNVLKTLEPGTADPICLSRCFCTCIAVLSSILDMTGANSNSPWANDERYTERLCQIYKDCDVMRSLQSQTGTFSSDIDDVAALSALSFFTKMAASGETIMLSLLVSHESAVFLPSRQIALSVSSTGQRNVWLASLNLIVACLRALSRNTEINDDISRRFYIIFVDFIIEHKDAVFRCLEQCSSVEFGPNASEHYTFTLDVLREAKLVLGMVSELCTQGVIDLFKRGCPELLDALIGQAASLLVSLSTFLGASGSARDIFRALNEVEASDDMTVDQGFAALGPLYRVLAGGLQNAKHEAIRFSSHFVLNCTRSTSEDDVEAKRTISNRWSTDNLDQSSSAALAMSSLEHKCRSGVTSKFAFQMELEAAECLFFAILILWKKHPASSSFVMYSDDEVAQLDAMSFVRSGTVIAFRSNIRPRIVLPFYNGTEVNQTQGDEVLRFARVLRSNTVNRRWHVRLVSHDGSPEDCLVEESQLAGIEDASRRIAMLSYFGAPETSSDLEAMRGPISVGHLILALRWCSQFYSEKCDDFFPCQPGPAITRLAELASAFVGLEVAVHRETRTRENSDADSHSKILSDQLLDLFGDATEFHGVFAGVHGRELGPREGRLKPIICTESWQGTRSQLRSCLDSAVVEMSTKLGEETRSIDVGGSLFIHRSGGTSPFRGLGM